MDLSEVRTSVARHPWETARANAILRILHGARVEPQAILDYGCGDGFTGERVRTVLGAARLLGLDIELSDEQCASRSNGVVTYANDWSRAPGGTFDLCLMCDVIEHVPNDQVLLRDVRAHLGDAGYVLITVPAFQALFTSHDRALRHFRRYSLGQLEGSVRSAGFDLVGSGYLFASLLPARGAAKLVESVKPRPESQDFGIGGWKGSPLLTRTLETVLGLDSTVMLGLASLGLKPPGLSAWALCKKRP